MYKVHCMNVIAKAGTDKLGDGYELTDKLEDADAVLVRSASMHELELPEGLMAIARAGAGVNNIPLEECAKKGIVVFNTPGANANGVKELVLAGMLLAARDISGGIQWVHENANDPEVAKKTEKKKKGFAGTEIGGKTLGVIGLGAIGVLVANAARNLGMKVLGYDPYISIEGAWNLDHHVRRVNDLDTLLEESDYITIHVPAMDSTKGMIDAAAIGKMKEGTVFLNFARDLLVDEEAMAAALESGKVRHYVSDFPNALSVKMKNAIVVPHLGASTEEAEENCAVMAAKEIRQYLEEGNISNSVNFPKIDLGPMKSESRLAIFHKNIPNMIGQISTTLSSIGVNIANMSDKSKGEFAYSLIDAESHIDQEVLDRLKAIEGVYRVRKIQ
ncbi:phosphoglycerate dehydrogenase [Cuneatibacter sp. NSJ-177]|uniref:phosphoglycerate dehydrogenase n=1 Tax=Cuneatibacter sp. NSJ-177 TaxID=2931401 RepID=UPI001FD034E2|nr:phosphoglycerate dehydrogenase [Cuneatibacter sp. NSJ-177]